MGELTFVDELPGETMRGGNARTLARAQEIRENPGKWAQWPSKSPASGVKKAMAKIDPGFEVVGRKIADGSVRAFVRFVAKPTPASNPNGSGGTAPTPPPSGWHLPPADGEAPKVKCGVCHEFVEIAEGEGRSDALSRHQKDDPICAAAAKRR